MEEQQVAGEVCPVCVKCGGERENKEHVIMEFNWYEEQRRTLNNKIKEIRQVIWEKKSGEDWGMSFTLDFKEKKRILMHEVKNCWEKSGKNQ